MRIEDTPQHVVVWDPEREYWDGAIVTTAVAAKLRARGVVSLPTKADHWRLSGVATFAKRPWGAGFPMDSTVPRLIAPITLFVHPEVRGLTWAARVVPGSERVPGQRTEGMVRFAADSGQRIPMHAAYGELEERAHYASSFVDPDEHGGWTIGGQGLVSVAAEGHYGFSLYGMAPGLSIAWVAAAMAPIRV